jgi:O-antigen/teichoic acid export membrane protein
VHPRKFIRDSVRFAFSQYVLRAMLMVRGLVAARVLGPQAYGAWNALQIMMDYGAIAPFGSQQGLDQMVPPRIVAEDPVALRRAKRAAIFNILVFSGVFVAICLGWVLARHSKVFDAWGLGGLALALVCVLSINVSNYQTSIMRSHGDFTTMSGWLVIQGATGGVLGLAALPFFGAWGLLWGWVVGCVAALVFSSVRSRALAPIEPTPSRESFELVRIGLPMFAFTASTMAMRNLDRIIILRSLGTQDLGYYSLSVMVLTMLLYMPDAVSYVLYPRILSDYGRSGRRPESIRPLVERVLQASSILVPALAGISYLFARPMVVVLLPKFLPGVDAMRVLCFGAVALAFTNFTSIVLMTLGRQAFLIPAAIVGIALYAVFDLAAVRMGYGITGVAWGTLLAYVVNSGALLALALSGLGARGRSIPIAIARLFAPLALALGVATALDRWLPAAGVELSWRVLRLAGAILSFVVLYGLLVYPFTRGMGLRLLLSEIELPVIGPLVRRVMGVQSGERAGG